MGELLHRASSQQALLDAWHDLRARARQEGRHTPEWESFEREAARRLAEISDQLRAGSWRPSPVQPVVIPKPKGGERRLGIPALADHVVERAILAIVDGIVDPDLLPWSFAYRKGLGVHDALRCLVEARAEGGRWVLRGDFTHCFDEIPRARLLARLAEMLPDPDLVEVVRLLVYRPERGADGTSPKGLHQGSSLSPVLANVFLDGFDRAMLREGYQVIRYADDFAVVVADRPEAEQALNAAQRAAAALTLDLSPEKCSIRSFDEGVPFLGETVSTGTGTRTERSTHPSATTVYVNEVGGLLRSRGSRLRLERDGELKFSIAFPRVRQVVLFGRVGMTTPFLQQVLTRGIDLVFLSDHGTYFGRLQPSTAANPFVRQRQYQAVTDPARSLDLAQRFVRGKIANLRAGLLRARRRTGSDGTVALIDRLQRSRETALRTSTINELMGVEGAASREYYAGLAALLEPAWSFTGRRRRPPPDPVNSLLSLGYTLLLHEAIAAIEVAGLDPYSGFLHQGRVGRPSLALDLIEELRPVVVDSVVIRALRTGMIRLEHFDIDTGPPTSCLLSRDGRRIFLAAYERRMLTLFTHTGRAGGCRTAWAWPCKREPCPTSSWAERTATSRCCGNDLPDRLRHR